MREGIILACSTIVDSFPYDYSTYTVREMYVLGYFPTQVLPRLRVPEVGKVPSILVAYSQDIPVKIMAIHPHIPCFVLLINSSSPGIEQHQEVTQKARIRIYNLYSTPYNHKQEFSERSVCVSLLLRLFWPMSSFRLLLLLSRRMSPLSSRTTMAT
jgi:hypothetical protein